MDYSIDAINSVHPEYQSNIEHWEFLNNSYLGGNHYKSQDYLTKYVFESAGEYRQRVMNTPLDNHCQSIINIYNSFIFKEPPVRDFGSIENSPYLAPFLEDADYDERSFNDFMSEVDRLSAVYGHAWVIVDKPTTEVVTAADEMYMGIRPYVSLFAPTAVVDWTYERQANGSYQLTYFKIIEAQYDDVVVYKIFTPELISTVQTKDGKTVILMDETPNALGYIPAVCVYDTRSPVKGVGVSAISGVAGMQLSIFSDYSEIEQLIRLSNHPSLVKTKDVDASAGAGSIITMDDQLDPALKPYLLQPNAGNLDSIRETIDSKVEAINRMANVGAIRAKETRQMSGVAIDSEFRNLDARNGKKAKNLALGEENIWQIFCDWIGAEWNGTVTYDDNYNTRDKLTDLNILKQATILLPNNEALRDEMAKQIAEMISEDPDVINSITGGDNTGLVEEVVESE